MAELWIWPAALGGLGLIFGSFIATIAIRWPQGRSALGGRSMCDSCGRSLDAIELVPLASWAALRGGCRSCGGRIAASHPLGEALGATVGVVAGWLAPGWEGVAGAVLGWLLLAAGMVDFAAFWLPNVLTGALATLGMATGVAGFDPSLADRAIGGMAGFASLWLVAAAYRRLRGREGLGGGDAKLFGAIGLWLGWRDLPSILLIASGLGLLAVGALRLRGRRLAPTDRLPLGTLLAVATFALWCVRRF